MIWLFTTLLVFTVCVIAYISLGLWLFLQVFKWIWNAYKVRQISKRTTNI